MKIAGSDLACAIPSNLQLVDADCIDIKADDRTSATREDNRNGQSHITKPYDSNLSAVRHKRQSSFEDATAAIV
jgi:hypothetical protein